MRKNLKVFRVKLNMTQEEMADKVGVKRATYSAIEIGARDGRQGFWQKLQKSCNVSDSDMWPLMLDE